MKETPPSAIPAEQVFRWMRSENIEVLGAAFEILHDAQLYTRIVPPLGFDDYREFHLRYYARCLRENPQGDWCDGRYMASYSLVNWFVGLWRDKATPRDALIELKDLLATLYREGDEELRCCIITGALEHLFQNRQLLKFFSDWKADPVLRSAYLEGRGYSQAMRTEQQSPGTA